MYVCVCSENANGNKVRQFFQKLSNCYLVYIMSIYKLLLHSIKAHHLEIKKKITTSLMSRFICLSEASRSYLTHSANPDCKRQDPTCPSARGGTQKPLLSTACGSDSKVNHFWGRQWLVYFSLNWKLKIFHNRIWENLPDVSFHCVLLAGLQDIMLRKANKSR